jgi:aminoglycoside phosphotransferase (APT) family kinase protein
MTSHVAFAGDVVVKSATNPLYRDWLARERRALEALATTGLRVASVLAYLERSDDVWLVLERLPGETLEAALAGTDDRRLREQLFADVGAQLARLHATPIPAALAPDEPFLDRRLAEAAHNLAHHPVDGDAALLERVRRTRPADAPPRLIHGDFSPDNVLVADGRVTAFIDWSDGGAGDPRMDVAFITDPLDVPDPRDHAAFHEGYGQPPLDRAVRQWFLDLYEFF